MLPQGEGEGIGTRVRALLALPPALSSLGRTIAWAGAAGAGVAVLATVAVVVIAVLRSGGDDPLPLVARESAQTPGSTQAQERTPQPTATEPAETAPTPTPTPEFSRCGSANSLLTFSRGEPDTLYLEWQQGSWQPVKGVQYQMRRWENHQPLDWGDWIDVPEDAVATCSHRVTGLQPDTAYDFRIRKIFEETSGTGGGATSLTTGLGEGATPRSYGVPSLDGNQVAEGDGVTEWRIAGSSDVITIPDGVRIRAGFPFHYDGLETSGYGVGIIDVASGKQMLLLGHGRAENTSGLPLFDEIIASLRFVPALPDPPPAPTVVTVQTGAPGELLLEWSPAPEMVGQSRWKHWVSGWEYRRRGKTEADWGPWIAVPGSTEETRSHLLTGLDHRNDYDLQVRAMAGEVGGRPSRTVTGHPALVDASGTPWATHHGPVVEGGRTWGLPGSDIVIDVPTGTRLELSGLVSVFKDGREGLAVLLTVWDNGSSILLHFDDLSEIQRQLVYTSDEPDMNAILDQIIASARRVTAPPTPTPVSATSQ